MGGWEIALAPRLVLSLFGLMSSGKGMGLATLWLLVLHRPLLMAGAP